MPTPVRLTNFKARADRSPSTSQRPNQGSKSGLKSLIALCAVALIALLGVPSPAHADGKYGDYMVYGQIEKTYLAKGGPSVLGNPTGPESDALNGGRFQAFGNSQSSIYWKSSVNGGVATLVRGAILSKWGKANWERGALGYPTNSESDAKAGGKFSNFQGGSIYWSSATGAHIVWGAIRDKWAAQNYENGSLGYPITDEYDENGGYQQLFQGGLVTYNVGADKNIDSSRASQISNNDPLNKYGLLISRSVPDVDVCSAVDADGRQTCVSEGTNAGNNEPPPDDTNARRAPSAPSTTTPAPDSPDSSSTIPSATSPSASATEPSAEATAPSATSAAEPTSSAPSPGQGASGTAPSPGVQPPTSSDGGAAPSDSAPRSTAPSERSATSKPSAKSTQGNPNRDAPKGLPADSKKAAYADKKPSDGSAQQRSVAPNAAAAASSFFKFAECETKGVHRWVGTNEYACVKTEWSLAVYQNGEKVGGAYGTVRHAIERTAINPQAEIAQSRILEGSWGTLKTARIELIASISGASGQSSISNGEYVMTLTTTETTERTQQKFGAIATDSYKTDRAAQGFRYQAAGYPAISIGNTTIVYPQVVCDNMSYFLTAYSECKLPEFPPILDLRAAANINIKQLADHVQNAQNHALPGAPWSGRPLGRISKKNPQYSTNRSTACPQKAQGGYTRPNGYNCDEYPFATTYQGAASYPLSGRTFPYCQIPQLPTEVYTPFGWSACMVPIEQNSSQGGINDSFYTKQRVIRDVQAFGEFYVNSN